MAPEGPQLEDLLESIDDMVALATIEGRLLYVNRAWRDKLGYAEHEIEGLSSYQMLHPEHDDEVRATNAKLLAGETARGVRRTLIAKDGRQFRVEGSISCRFKEGKPDYVRSIFQDITEREKLERMKDELLAIANHEMRSPLMSILSSLELLRKDCEGLPERSKRFLEIASSNSQRLLNLVNDYLDLEKLASGGAPFNLKPLELTPLVERALESNRPLGAANGVSLELTEGLPGVRVEADADRLTQVVTNLLSNAVKFSRPGGTVLVRMARRGAAVRVSVADEGQGIPDDFRDKVFGKFMQALVHGKTGSGLGLAISKTIVEKHGGRIDFDSEAGKGATFYFELAERR